MDRKDVIVRTLRSRVLSSEELAAEAKTIIWPETVTSHTSGIRYYTLISDWPDFEVMFVRAVMLALTVKESEAFAKSLVNETGEAWTEMLAFAWLEDWPDVRRLVLAMKVLYDRLLKSEKVRAFLANSSEFSDPALSESQRLNLRLHSILSTAAVNNYLRGTGRLAEVIGVGQSYPIPRIFE